MQGPSEMGARGVLEYWDRTADLKDITVPTLVIGAQYDTMDPEHMAMYDAQETYFHGVIDFLESVDGGR